MLQDNISLKPFNTFAIDVKAQHFVQIKEFNQLQQFLTQPQWQDIPKMILGGGSNVLLTHDFMGLVLQVAITGVEVIDENDKHIWLKVGAGENWHQFVCYCLERQYAGIENLSLIPGTVGAAPIQNIGAYGVELQQVFVELTAASLHDGSVHTFDHYACQFAYRDSIFKRTLKNQFFITAVTFRLDKSPRFHLDYAGLTQMLDEMGVVQANLQSVSAAVCKIRQQKLPNPKQIANAGSFFKNPSVSLQQLAELQQSSKNLPSFEMKDGSYKISAAWLIEQCGWRGYREGSAGVYVNHALVLVNYGGASGTQLQQLANNIQQSVFEKYAIHLEPEVNII